MTALLVLLVATACPLTVHPAAKETTPIASAGEGVRYTKFALEGNAAVNASEHWVAILWLSYGYPTAILWLWVASDTGLLSYGYPVTRLSRFTTPLIFRDAKRSIHPHATRYAHVPVRGASNSKSIKCVPTENRRVPRRATAVHLAVVECALATPLQIGAMGRCGEVDVVQHP